MRHARTLGGSASAALVLALCAGGCGGNNLDGPTERFVGSWQYLEGQAAGSLVCGMSRIDETPHGNKILATGIDAALVDLTASDLDSEIHCNFRFDVSGPVATARTDQSCALTGGNDVISFNPDPDVQKDPPDAWTFTLTSPTEAEESLRTTVTVYQPATQVGAQPTTMACDYQMTAHLKRVSKD